MEISGISSVFPFMIPNDEKDNDAAKVSLQKTADTVDVHSPELLTDEDAEVVLADTMNMIVQDRSAALSVHNLSEQRVFALLSA